jgi:hypothetical protein
MLLDRNLEFGENGTCGAASNSLQVTASTAALATGLNSSLLGNPVARANLSGDVAVVTTFFPVTENLPHARVI